MDLIRSGGVLAAPDRVVMEVLNVLRRKHRMTMLDERQVVHAAATIESCFNQIVPSTSLAQEAVRLSITLDHSIYDCACLACSMLLAMPLVTEDHVFAEKARTKISNAQVLTLDRS